MEENLKQLLIKDLCYRLSYGVICTDSRQGDSKITEIDVEIEIVYCDDFDEYIEIKDCKPYLRPMDSMTEEEKEEMHNLLSPEGTAMYRNEGIAIPINHCGDFVPYEFMSRIIDYLNAHHFDYRGLIERGLALEAPKRMYNLND